VPKGEKNRKLTDADRDEIVRLYCTPEAGRVVGVPTIARRYGVRNWTIQQLLKKRGVQQRTKSQGQNPGLDRGPRGPYRIDTSRTTFAERLEARGADRPACACGCGQLVGWDHSKMTWRRFASRRCYRPDAPYKNLLWLLREYIIAGRSAADIAREQGVAESTILRRLHRFGVPIRDSSESKRGRMVGPLNPAWRGGTTPARQKVYKTPRWLLIRQFVLDRDGHRCKRCPSTENLCIHHTHPWAIFETWRFVPSGLITLCKPCHNWVHSRANTNREFLV
jgi:transposase-like protein